MIKVHCVVYPPGLYTKKIMNNIDLMKQHFQLNWTKSYDGCQYSETIELTISRLLKLWNKQRNRAEPQPVDCLIIQEQDEDSKKIYDEKAAKSCPSYLIWSIFTRRRELQKVQSLEGRAENSPGRRAGRMVTGLTDERVTSPIHPQLTLYFYELKWTTNWP